MGNSAPDAAAYLLGDSDVDPRFPRNWQGVRSALVEADAGVRAYLATDAGALVASGGYCAPTNMLAGYVMHHRNGDPRDNSPSNLELHPIRHPEPIPAAYRVASSIDVPEWFAVRCQRCQAVYAFDPERGAEARAIFDGDGHGLGGTCDPLTRTRAASGPSETPYDWQREREETARMQRRW